MPPTGQIDTIGERPEAQARGGVGLDRRPFDEPARAVAGATSRRCLLRDALGIRERGCPAGLCEVVHAS